METSPEELEKTAKTSTQIGLFGDPLSVLIVLFLNLVQTFFSKPLKRLEKLHRGRLNGRRRRLNALAFE